MRIWIRLVAVMLICVFRSTTAQDMPITQVLIDGEGWELVGEGYGFTEGPAVDVEGNVFFSDPKNHRIYRAGLDGTVTLFAENTEKTSGLMFGPDGRLYGCSRIGNLLPRLQEHRRQRRQLIRRISLRLRQPQRRQP